MKENGWRIFLSYRGSTEGSRFSKRLYNYLTEDPMHENIYGKVYYSPETAKPGDNFNTEIPDFMKAIEYFVMPLTKEYYSDFWDEENDCPNEASITYKELIAALAVGSRFVCVAFPGFEVNKELLGRLFQNDAVKISCSLILDYESQPEEELFRQIGDAMVRDDYDISGMAELYKSMNPNVHLAFRRDIDKIPFYQKLHDVKTITLLNYASSSFITGIDIASIYHESDYLKRWFRYHLSKGDIEADVVLTDPHSTAAQDAAQYKMYPLGLTVKKEDIILHNMNKLFQFMEAFPDSKVNVYLTQIALPYGIMMTEHTNSDNNHIKVDLYAPVTHDDRKRPSFCLLQSEKETSEMYAFFESNIRNIMHNYSYRFDGHPDVSWLLKKQIIHRAQIKPEIQPHTKGAYEECIAAKYPIEVDLLCMKDGTIVVSRDDVALAPYGYDDKLSNLTASDLRKINRQRPPADKILAFTEFLELINGKVPVLLEIKTAEKVMTPVLEKYIEKIVQVLQQYFKLCSAFFGAKHGGYGPGVAIHSSNPYALKLVKNKDCLIPCGIISTDFSGIRDEVGEAFYQMHMKAQYLDIITPDFISYDIRHLDNGVARSVCEKLGIPLLGWTVIDEDTQNLSIDGRCDNIIIEGAKTYK